MPEMEGGRRRRRRAGVGEETQEEGRCRQQAAVAQIQDLVATAGARARHLAGNKGAKAAHGRNSIWEASGMNRPQTILSAEACLTKQNEAVRMLTRRGMLRRMRRQQAGEV